MKEFSEKCHDIKTLQELKDVAEHQYISVSGKITSLFPTEKITIKSTGHHLTKMVFLLADQTAVYRSVAWEAHIELLQEDKTYCISNASLRSFNGEKYISIGQNSKVMQIEDIGEVVSDNEVPIPNPTGSAKVVKAEVVTVVMIDSYKSCHNCNAKVSPQPNAVLATCDKCNSKMKIAKCADQSVANVILEDEHKKVYKVTIFNEVLHQICNYG